MGEDVRHGNAGEPDSGVFGLWNSLLRLWIRDTRPVARAVSLVL